MEKKIKQLRDGQLFRLVRYRKNATVYQLQTMERGSRVAVITSESSGRTYRKPGARIVYPL